MNNAVSLNVESVIVDYLVPLLGFAASVTGASDRLHEDENSLGPLGAFIEVPAVIVEVGEMPTVLETNPVYQGEVTVTVRHSTERSTVRSHNTDANLVADALWEEADIYASVSENQYLTLSGINHVSTSFLREGRKLETKIVFNIQISSKEI